MPRHGLTSLSRDRAQRQDRRPERGVRSRRGQDAKDLTAERDARPPLASVSQVDYGRALRGTLLTPWFAVSAGLIIAASLTCASPRTALSFPPVAPGRCAGTGCPPAGQAASGQGHQAAGSEVGLNVPDARRVRHGAQPVTVRYELLPPRRSQFMAVIVLSGRRALGRWSLSFLLPGARVDSVMWANWAPYGRSGLMIEGAPLPWPRSGADAARIVISGTGAPRWPTGCVLDHAACVFRALPVRPPSGA